MRTHFKPSHLPQLVLQRAERFQIYQITTSNYNSCRVTSHLLLAFAKKSLTVFSMFERFKFLVICVAALAVGMIQVFGVQTGFLCKCTGKATSSITCRAVVCHPASDCPSKANGKTGEKCPGERPHSEVRKQVLLTNASTEFVLPALILTDIPETFQTPCPGALPMASLLVVERPKVPEYASPPMPQLVAETIVMLV